MSDHSEQRYKNLKVAIADALLSPPATVNMGIEGMITASQGKAAQGQDGDTPQTPKLFSRDGLQGLLSPQQLMVLFYQWNPYGEEAKQEASNCITYPPQALVDLHMLGVLPPIPSDRRSAALFLEDGKIIVDDDKAVLLGVAILCGDLELAPLDSQRMEHALKHWHRALELEDTIISQGNHYSEEEIRELAKARIATSETFYSLVHCPVAEDEREMISLMAPYEGQRHIVSDQRNEKRISLELGERMIAEIFDFFAILERWGESSSVAPVGDDFLEKIAHLTKSYLLQQHGEEAVNNLIHLGEQVIRLSPEEQAEFLLPIAAFMTWESLIRFSVLAREYNLEWAFAAVEW